MLGANLDTDSNNDGWIDHATDDPVETQYPGACLAYYSGHPEELSEVDISPIDVTPQQAGEFTGKLTFSGNIHVWTDRQKTMAITSGEPWDLYTSPSGPVVVYVEGDAAGGSSMTWTVLAGETPLASDTVDFTLLTTTLAVTNMAPLTILPPSDESGFADRRSSEEDSDQIIKLPDGFQSNTAAITGAAFKRGGDVPEAGGVWSYVPHDTTYGTAAPWDPYHPYGDGPAATGDWGGAGVLRYHYRRERQDAKGKCRLGQRRRRQPRRIHFQTL